MHLKYTFYFSLIENGFYFFSLEKKALEIAIENVYDFLMNSGPPRQKAIVRPVKFKNNSVISFENWIVSFEIIKMSIPFVIIKH